MFLSSFFDTLTNKMITETEKEKMESDQKGDSQRRPPIVVVVGHVDHGKTSLLDYIRKTNVAAKEAGGITQSIGAYEVIHGGSKITFIDTPGHEAFSKMRARGANVADIAILVVAADEGVKPQTEESIKILKDTNTPFIVVLTKIDKPNINIERVRNELLAAGVFLEGYGGQVSFCGVSSKTGEGINELLDLINLLGEIENLTYNPKNPASGYILEAKVNSQRGNEVYVIVKDGTLRRGDKIYTKTAYGKVKILENFLGKPTSQIQPSSPAIIYGFETLPQAGEDFFVGEFKRFKEESRLKSGLESSIFSDYLQQKIRLKENDFNLILKAADLGSLEAFSSIIESLKPQNKNIKVVHKSVGDVADNDVKLAIASRAHIFGFRNKVSKTAQSLAENYNIKIITSNIIYELIKILEEFLTSSENQKPVGGLKVLAVFNQKKLNEQLVGGRVMTGIFKLKSNFEIRRGIPESDVSAEDLDGKLKGEVVGFGRVLNLREGKKDIVQAESGKEVGILVDSKILIQVGDWLIIKSDKN